MRRYFIKSKELGSDKTAYEEYHIGDRIVRLYTEPACAFPVMIPMRELELRQYDNKEYSANQLYTAMCIIKQFYSYSRSIDLYDNYVIMRTKEFVLAGEGYRYSAQDIKVNLKEETGYSTKVKIGRTRTVNDFKLSDKVAVEDLTPDKILEVIQNSNIIKEE